LWRKQLGKDQTEFVVCALPLGGYVRMLDEREAPVEASEQARAFNRQPLLRRAAIVAAGPIANLLLAIVLYAAAHWIGIDEPKAVLGPPTPATLAERAGLRTGDWVRAVAPESGNTPEWQDVLSMTDLRWEITQAALRQQPLMLQVSDRDGRGSRTLRLDLSGIESRAVDAQLMKTIGLPAPFSEPLLGEVKAGGPGERAGLKKGDRVLSIDGKGIADAQSLREAIRGGLRDGVAIAQAWRIERSGQPLDITITLRAAQDGNAPAVGRIDAFVGAPAEMVTVRHGPIDGLWLGAVRTWEVSTLTVKMLGRMLIGEASIKNLSGPLTIADYAGQSVQQGLAYYLGFLALVSVSLGVLNLLPLPMLDGGHLMYYIFEGVTGRPPTDVWLARLQRGGLAVLMLMMSVALYNDVARLLGLN
jgi:regulator of sigma E protease